MSIHHANLINPRPINQTSEIWHRHNANPLWICQPKRVTNSYLTWEQAYCRGLTEVSRRTTVKKIQAANVFTLPLPISDSLPTQCQSWTNLPIQCQCQSSINVTNPSNQYPYPTRTDKSANPLTISQCNANPHQSTTTQYGRTVNSWWN